MNQIHSSTEAGAGGGGPVRGFVKSCPRFGGKVGAQRHTPPRSDLRSDSPVLAVPVPTALGGRNTKGVGSIFAGAHRSKNVDSTFAQRHTENALPTALVPIVPKRVAARKKDGWKLAESYIDQASGKSGERPAFKRLFEDAARRKFDLVCFWSLDRFSREGVLETLQHLQRLTASGVDYKSYTEQYLDSVGVFRDAVLSILATIAKQERIRIRERTVAGLERARAQGKSLGRPKLVIDREKVLRLRRNGKSLAEIASALGISKTSAHRLAAD